MQAEIASTHPAQSWHFALIAAWWVDFKPVKINRSDTFKGDVQGGYSTQSNKKKIQEDCRSFFLALTPYWGFAWDIAYYGVIVEVEELVQCLHPWRLVAVKIRRQAYCNAWASTALLVHCGVGLYRYFGIQLSPVTRTLFKNDSNIGKIHKKLQILCWHHIIKTCFTVDIEADVCWNSNSKWLSQFVSLK